MDITKFTIFNEDKANDFAKVRVKAIGEKWGAEAVNHEAFNGYAVGFQEAEEIYKNLLYKYMKIVCDAEGVDFLSPKYIEDLTPKELKTLQSVSDLI